MQPSVQTNGTPPSPVARVHNGRGASQVKPQVPQFGDEARDASQPVRSSRSQSPKSGRQAPMTTQAPLEHPTTAVFTFARSRQLLSQRPQRSGTSTLTQIPLQTIWPAGH